MIQRIQTLWMVLTAVLVATVIFIPAVSFRAGGADFELMSYGIRSGGTSDAIAQFYGTGEASGEVTTSTLSICVVCLLALAALVPFVTVFLFRNRTLQARLLGAEFALLAGGAGFLGWYIWSVWRRVVESMSEDFFFSFFPLLLVVALVTNWLAIRGVLRDEIMVRAADRLR